MASPDVAERLPILLDCLYGDFAVHCRFRNEAEVERHCREQGLEIKSVVAYTGWVLVVAAKPGIEREAGLP